MRGGCYRMATGRGKGPILKTPLGRLAASVVALSLVLAGSSGAQVPQTLQNDPFAQEVLRALQQRAAPPPDTTQLQPSTEIRTSPVYPPEPSLPQSPNAATTNAFGPSPAD